MVLFPTFLFCNYSRINAAERIDEVDSFRELVFGIDQEKAKLTFAPKFIKVIRGDTVFVYATNASTAEDALQENGYILSADSKIETFSEEALSDFSVIKIIKLKTESETREVEIPYSTRMYESWKYSIGEEVVEQNGVPGIKEQYIQSYYEDGVLIKEDIISESVVSEPVEEIIAIGSATYTLDGITLRGYDCSYWYSVVESGYYSSQEKQWLKFLMYCESGCNAESNKSFYKGLFQWSPTLWKELYSENIFDGDAQIKHTVEKLRAGADLNRMWPACYKKYVAKYGEVE